MSRILAIEDSQSIRLLLDRRFQLAGHRIECFSNSPEAIHELGRREPKDLPDLVLLDLGLPEYDGVMALPEISRVAPGVPVILLSARYDLDRIELPVEVAGRVAKPIDFNLLLGLVAGLAGQPRTSS